MDILILAILIVLGLIFLIIEVLMPGISIGAILSLICYGRAIYMIYNRFDFLTATLILLGVAVISVVALVLTLRSKTWDKLSLKSKIDSSSSTLPQDTLEVGMQGVAISRLSPMGKIEVNGSLYEAKSVDRYIDVRSEVEIVGFDNFSVIVKMLNK